MVTGTKALKFSGSFTLKENTYHKASITNGERIEVLLKGKDMEKYKNKNVVVDITIREE